MVLRDSARKHLEPDWVRDLWRFSDFGVLETQTLQDSPKELLFIWVIFTHVRLARTLGPTVKFLMDEARPRATK